MARESRSETAPARPRARALTPTTLAALWVVVVLELVLPVPGLLTLGALYVLAARPGWFLSLVESLYADRDR